MTKAKKPRLTELQKAFVVEYIKNGCNGRQAYLKAAPGVKIQSAETEASKLLRIPKVAKALSKHTLNVDELSKEAIEADIVWAKETAKDKEDYSAVAQIAMNGAKLRGLLVDKHEVSAVPQAKVDEIRRLAVQEALKTLQAPNGNGQNPVLDTSRSEESSGDIPSGSEAQEA